MLKYHIKETLHFCLLFASDLQFLELNAYDYLNGSKFLLSLIEVEIIKYCSLRLCSKSNRKAMNRNWSNQKANPALKTKAGNK